MRIIFFGTPLFAVPSLEALIESGEEIVAAVTQPDRAKGRGHRVCPPPVKELALEKGVRVIQPSGVRTQAFLDELSGLRPDAIAVVAFGRILPPSILRLPPLGCVNVHFSLLPKYRGAAPVQWAIINGDTRTGVTTMLMDEGLDTGDILLQEETEISDSDTAASLGEKLSVIGASLLLKTLRGLREGSLAPRPQRGEPTYAPPLRKEDGNIDWSLPADKISSLIRGAWPWPGAYGSLRGERLIISGARAMGDGTGNAPGMIVKVGPDGLIVGTGEGLIALNEVKPEGKRQMSAAAYARGRHIEEGVFFDNP